MAKLDGKAAVVTGGSSGIGGATALALAGEGAAVAIGGRNAAALDEVASEVTSRGGRAVSQVMDVRDEAQVVTLVDAAVREFGRLDIMVNNAGITDLGSIAEGEVSRWRELLETNVLGLLVGCREAIRAMKANDPPGGRIVNISSDITRQTHPTTQVYSATKHAVDAISAGLREEVRDLNIRVTVVKPGPTLTNIGRTLPQELLDNAARALGVEPVRQGEYLPPEWAERMLKEHPELLLSPEAIAGAVLYAVTQPPAVQVDEVLVRPAKGLSFMG